MLGECAYPKCSNEATCKLNNKPVCSDCLPIALKAIGEKIPFREWKPPKNISQNEIDEAFDEWMDKIENQQ